MSKYTTEVRYICEVEAGYDESQGYKKVGEIIDLARPKIFDFDYPIFDEAYRPVLEAKILRHYYTREICEETVGLWKLRLEDKLNLIMPYFNKLYQSELIEFNPLYDTDYTVNHTGNATDTLGESTDNTRTFNKDTDTEYSETNGNTRTFNKDTDTDYSETNGNTRTFNKDTGTDYSETNGNTRTLNTQDSESGSNAPKNVRWDLYSDTPQGGINGITNDTDSVANNTYLTNARKITDDGTGSTTSRTLNQTGTITDSGSKSGNNDVEERGTIADSGSKSGSNVVEERGTIADSGSVSGSNGVEERGTIGDTGTRSVNSTNLNSYIDRVSGKRGTISYSKMLMEFRESLLRIDEMVMNELSSLFFGLWY